MKHISLIVLSNTVNESIHRMNLNCFYSFINGVKNIRNVSYEIILVETNQDNQYRYHLDFIKVITPDESFNFHRFLNIGISIAEGDYYVLSNNDVIFDENWLLEIQGVIKKNNKILSFSPYDRTSNKLPKNIIQNSDYIIGYEIQKHLTGWCLCIDKRVIQKIKKLDERFDFYYADFDYAMMLIKYNINHALVTKSIAKHLESMSSNKKKYVIDSSLKKELPGYIIKENWTWVLENDKMIEGIIKYHKKWGSKKMIKLKLLISKYLKIMKLGYFNRYILLHN